MKKLFIIAILSCNFLNAQNVFPTTGNVGIGTIGPSEKLEVNTGNIFLNSTAGQFVRWNNTGAAPPSFTTRSAGTKLVLWPSMSAGATDYAIGIDNGTIWQAVPQSNAGNSHKFYGGTTPLMTIRGDGNVGIGTTAPAEKLEVNSGNIFLNGASGQFVRWSNTGAAPPSFTTRSAGTKLVLWSSVGAGATDYAIGIDGSTLWQGVPVNNALHSHKFYAGTTPLMTIRGDGNVGIGTTNPTAKLDVAGTALISSLAGEGNRMVVANANGLLTTQAVLPGGDNLGNHTAVQTLNMNNNSIIGTSTVGIGTTAPAEKLEVNGGNIFLNSSAGQFIRWSNTGSAPPIFDTRSAGTKLVLWPGADNTASMDHAIGIDDGSIWQAVPVNGISQSHKFYGGGTPLMTIRGDGNVGIGTTGPAEKLEVSGGNIFLNSSVGQFIRWSNTGSAPPSFNIRSAGTKLVLHPGVSAGAADHAIGIENSANWYGVPSNLHSHKFYAGTSELMTIRGDGNVGIGTVNPAYKLDVIGTIRARKVKVNLEGADFVFEDGYKLMPLNELEKFVKQNKHLPEIAPAKEMQENGSDLGGLSVQLLQKIEELTLHVIEQNKKLEQQNKEVEELTLHAIKQNNKLEQQNKKIESLEAKINNK
jgi:hypothetical protein